VSKKRIFWLLLMGCVTNVGFCNAINPLSIFYAKGWFVGASAGLVWPQLGESNTSVLNGNDAQAPYNSDLYSIDKTPGSTNDWSLYAGYRWDRSQQILPHYSVALRYEHLSRFKIEGTVDQYSLPDFVNYNYHLYGSSNIFSAQGKVDLYDFHSFDPYLTLGLGTANTTVEGYKESPYSGIDARISPGYQNNSASHFTYSLGLGLDYFITPKITASLGYEYADLGNVKSGDGTSTWSGSSLSFGRLTTNTVLLSVFYQLT